MNSTNFSLRDQNISGNQDILSTNQFNDNALKERKPKSRIPVLDGLRALACLGVLSYHIIGEARLAGIWGRLQDIHTVTGMFAYVALTLAYAGDSGVILFFLLSGFLLFLPYAKALLFQSSWPSFSRYCLRRTFRILPGYYAALFLMILIFHPQFFYANHWSDLLLFLNFGMSHTLSQQLNGPFWTLAIEFQFYLLLPIIAWLFSLIVCRGTLHWRMLKLTGCLLAMVAWGLLTRYWGLFLANTSKLDFVIPQRVSIALIPYLYSDTGKYYEVFAVGMLVAMVYTYTQYAPCADAWRVRIRRLSPLLFTVGLALLFLLSLCYFYFSNINIDVYNYYKHYAEYISKYHIFTFLNSRVPIIIYSCWPLWQALGYAIGYGLCMVALLYGSRKLKGPFEWSLLRWLASISFSFYMWHQPLLDVFRHVVLVNIWLQGGWSPLMQYGAFWCWTLMFIVPIAAMLYRWVEKPGISLGEWLIRKFEK